MSVTPDWAAWNRLSPEEQAADQIRSRLPPRASKGSPGGARPRTQFRRAPGPLAHALAAFF